MELVESGSVRLGPDLQVLRLQAEALRLPPAAGQLSCRLTELRLRLLPLLSLRGRLSRQLRHPLLQLYRQRAKLRTGIFYLSFIIYQMQFTK